MNDSFPPLPPAIVMCCRQPIMAVRLPDGRIVGIIQSMCEPLQLDRTAQLRRIRRNESLARHLLLVPILTNGGVQKMDVLIASAIPRWLEGIQVSRLAPAKRPLARALQREVEEALNRHFSRTEAAPPPRPQREQTTRSSDSPAQMIAEVAQTMGEAAQLIVGAVQAMGEVAQRLEAERQATNDHLAALEGRQTASDAAQHAMGEHLVQISERQEVAEARWEALGDYVVETRERVTALEQQKSDTSADKAAAAPALDSSLLSPLRLTQLYMLARQARRQRGTPVSAQLAALAEAFGVPDVSDLPESAWEEVLAWFWERQGG